MSIRIGARQDTSYLFTNMNNKNSSAVGGSMGWLGDYASIKNGSYGKLMKAYYSETGNERVSALAKDSVNKAKSTDKTLSEWKATKQDLSEANSAADSLKSSADAMLKKGKDSVFEKEDKDAAYDAVSSFVKNYNETVKAAGSVSDKSVAGRLSSLTGNTGIYAKKLSDIGITVNDDKTLSIDKEAFQKADLSKAQELFEGNGSFGYRTAAQAGILANAAENAVSSMGTYSAAGTANYSTGNLFNFYM